MTVGRFCTGTSGERSRKYVYMAADGAEPAAFSLIFSCVMEITIPLFFVPVGKADCRFARRGKGTNSM